MRLNTETAEEQQRTMLRSLRIRAAEDAYMFDRYSPEDCDYETSVEYVEHLKYAKQQRTKVQDYSKDLSDDSSHEEEDLTFQ